MMPVDKFVTSLRQQGITIWAEADQLRCRAPKGALTRELQEILKQRKAELLDFLAAARLALRQDLPPIARADRSGRLELSYAQARLWVAAQLAGSAAEYNISAALRLDGPLDAGALERAVAEIGRRHEALRTNFVVVDGQPTQVIAPTLRGPLELVDLSGLEPAERAREVQRRAEAENFHAFDLAAEPLLRVVLLREAPRAHVLLATMHHLVSDGWSIGVLARELGALYDACHVGAASPLPELAAQYADYAHWQRQWLSGDHLRGQLDYWRRQLAGANGRLNLPRARTGRTGTGRVSFALSAALTDGLKALARRTQTTPFMALLSGLGALLARTSGQEDFNVGAPVANRNRQELEPLIGFFVNLLALRLDLRGEPTFRQALERVRQTVLGAQANQDLPFERLVDELYPQRESGPLFEVMVIHDAPAPDLALAGLTVRPLESDRPLSLGARSDLDLYWSEEAGQLRGLFCFPAERFEPETIQRLSENFAALLAGAVADPDQPIGQLAVGDLRLPPLTRLAADSGALSPHQERLWFIDRFERANVYAASPIYHNIPLLLRWDGPVDVARLEQAVLTLSQRHAAWRTRVLAQGEALEQVIDPTARVPLAWLPPATDTLSAALAEASRPFDLPTELPVRAAWLPDDAGGWLVLTLHHLLADRRSAELLARELVALYRGQTLAEPAVRYLDYAAWQRALPAASRERLLLYWRWQLRGRLAALDLPTDRPRPAIHTYTAARLEFALPTDLVHRLDELAARAPATAWLLAAFKALLRAYARQDEIVVGTSDPGRRDQPTRSIVGPLANLVVLRSHLRADQTLGQLAERLGRDLAQAHAHRELPFDELVLELKPEKDMSRTALFDVLFEVESQELPRWDLDGTTVTCRETNLGYGKYDLNLLLRRQGGGYAGTLVYNADLFDPATAARLGRHYQRALSQLAAGGADQPLGQIAWLDAAERQAQIETWNATAAQYETGLTIHQRFERQVNQTPERIAVACAGRTLTYRELDQQANRVAHYLRAQDLQPDQLVGLCLDRSESMIVAMLGILKAGGAYLNLDPDFPPERLTFMTQDSGLRHLITSSALRERFPADQGACLLWDRDALADYSSAPVTDLAGPGHLAYCIYTSGSTGRPKGVLLEHRQVIRLMENDRFQFQFGPEDVWTLFHSFGFDFSVWEMYGALFYGGKVVVVPKAITQDPRRFLELLVQERVTVLNQVPTAFYALAAEALQAPGTNLAVRYVIFGGEALQPAQLAAWRAAYPDTRLINMYGITETTVHATFREVTPEDLRDNVSNVGGPIPTTTIYLLDPRGDLLPTGVPGEVCVGGWGLARGYLNRPELTAEKFVPDPFGREPGARLYRSGDLARYRRDGSLEFLGRIDHQVKLRGYRVELGEIESLLNRCAGVREAVVTLREEGQQLVAYVVGATDPEALRLELGRRLPGYMVPTAFVFLPALPLTASGKVDRKKLPAPRRVTEVDESQPGAWTATEEILGQIWQRLLGVEAVGRTANFFELGGHSLLAAQMVSQARAALGVELPLQAVFEAPRLSDYAARLAAAGRAGQTPAPPITRQPAGGPRPLSFAQRRLWFLEELHGPSALYNMPGAARLRGPLRRDALFQAFQEIIERHETLRTRFAEVDGEPIQVIDEPTPFALPAVDLSSLPPPERDQEARRLAAEEARRPFDLKGTLLWRCTLIILDDTAHILLINLHHSISDGWSMGVLLREMRALYAAYAQSEVSPLPALNVQYGDYAVWQRDWFAGNVRQAQLDYWRNRLDGAPSRSMIPTDRPIPAARKYPGRIERFEIDAELTGRLRTLGRATQTTLFMTLYAGFAALLSRYSGQEDLVVGTPIANRPRAELEPLIGFFANTLPLRVSLAGDPTVTELLARGRQTCLEAYAHQDLPFEQLVEELQPERNLNQTPFFQAMFVMRNTPDEELVMPGLEVSSLPQETGAAKFELTLSLLEADGKISGVLEFDAELFEDSTARQLLSHYRTLLSGMTAQPSRRVAALPLLDAEERQRIIVDWNATAVNYPREVTLPQLFERQVTQSPDGCALVFGGETLTYHEFNARANHLAHWLRKRGVGAETLVGVCLERSFEMVIALYGILKAGGAYLPLDPELPAERIGFLIEDAGLDVVLTQRRWKHSIPAGRAEIGVLDTDEMRLELEPAHNLQPRAGPDNAAYVIYTSGSTGQPKGVLITHRSVCNRLLWMQEAHRLAPEDRVLQKTPYSFDVSVWEFFWPLQTGARLVIAPPGTHRENAELVKLIAREKITVLHFVPSPLETFLEEPGSGELASIRMVFCSGEALSAPLTARALARLPWAEWHNLYGPTEAAVDVTWWRCEHGLERATAPIGRPIANTQTYILDPRLEPVPIGAVGELYLGGVQLARGYLKRPSLTAERFVPSPFANSPGERLYRTGDLVRHLPDGNIEFLGRLDHQVKIRGLRIELGEIESVLARHPAVQGAVALAIPDPRRGAGADAKRLIAYIAPRTPVSPGELRKWLRGQLAEYMIPSAFITLAAAPLTASGKIDRKRLPRPDTLLDEPDVNNVYAPPRTAAEELLVILWSELLGIELVGIHQNFFELGGHSLIATRVMSRARDWFGIELPVRALFESPTIAELAARIETSRGDRPPALAPIVRSLRDGRAPLSFAQQRLWFLDRLAGPTATYNLPAAIRLTGALDVAALEWSVTEIVRRHESLRTIFAEVDGEPVQVICPPERLIWQVIPIAESTEADQASAVARQVAAEAQRPFDLARDWPLRVTLLRLGEASHVLLITLHHIAADAWSIGVFARELSAAYAGRIGGRPPAIPEPAIQYADYARWQREWIDSEAIGAQLAYWKTKLDAAPELLALPLDRPRPATQTYRGSILAFKLDAATTQQLQQLSRDTGATLFMTLLAGFAALLARYGRADDVVIGTPIANRNRSELEPLIGFFVNTLALRVRLERSTSVAELIRQVRQTCLEAYAHQDVPFERLVEILQPRRNLSHAPLFQVMFALQNAEAGGLELPGLELASLPQESVSAKFDLTVSVQATADGMSGLAEYNTDLFDATTIERMIGHFTEMLRAMPGQNDRPAMALPWLTEDERRRLPHEGSAAALPPAAEPTFIERFEAQVATGPNREAVVSGDVSITYAELNRRANRLAHALRRRGVGPEARVGLCVARNLETIVGIVGILKSGAAYVPLDPAYPAERLAYMVADCRPTVALAEPEQLNLPSSPSLMVRRIGELESEAGSESNPTFARPPASAAYVIYTSGSTGRPKGVVVSHQNLGNLIQATIDLYALTPDSRVLQFLSLGFDVGTADVVMTLASGATLCLCPPAAAMPGAELIELMREQRITHAQLSGSLLPLLPFEELPELRALTVGGETPAVDAMKRWARGRRLLNAYGPTETTVQVTAGLWSLGQRAAHIGSALLNSRVYILDPEDQPAPIGVAGELCVGGPQVSRGYLGQPAPTAERFVPDPFSHNAGARMYRTGDLARWLPGENGGVGPIEFLGRVDHQVKWRGFRIELGEIESVLSQYPGIREAAAILRGSSTSATDVGDQYLAGYVVPVGGQTPTAADLRAWLMQRLPEHMVPTVFVILSTLPRNAHGKVERRLLPAPDSARATTGYVAPRTATETRLAEIWGAVLGLKQVGVNDGFFELGGHSMRAVRLMALVKHEFGQQLPLATLFQHSTIAELAEAIERKELRAVWSPLVTIQPRGVKPPFFCVPGTGGNPLYFHALAAALAAHGQPFHAFQAVGLDGEQRPHASIEEIAAANVKALLEAQPRGPFFLGGHSFGSYVAFEMARQLQAQRHEVALLAVLDTPAPSETPAPRPEPRADREWIQEIGHVLAELHQQKLDLSAEDLAGMNWEEQLAWLTERLKAAGIVPPSAEVKELRGLANVYRAQAEMHYNPHSEPTVELALFRAAEISPTLEGSGDDDAWGWDRFALGAVSVDRVPGNHLTMMTSPGVTILAERLAYRLGS